MNGCKQPFLLFIPSKQNTDVEGSPYNEHMMTKFKSPSDASSSNGVESMRSHGIDEMSHRNTAVLMLQEKQMARSTESEDCYFITTISYGENKFFCSDMHCVCVFTHNTLKKSTFFF
jgi:hypothetical protein